MIRDLLPYIWATITICSLIIGAISLAQFTVYPRAWLGCFGLGWMIMAIGSLLLTIYNVIASTG